MMKVRMKEAVLSEGGWHRPGEVFEASDETAAVILEFGWGEAVAEEKPPKAPKEPKKKAKK